MTLLRRLAYPFRLTAYSFRQAWLTSARVWDWLLSRDAFRSEPRRPVRLQLEGLEDRVVPSTTAIDDFAVSPTGSAVTISVLANDTDASSVSAVGTPVQGSASVSNGQVIYTPSTGATGFDHFSYTATDGNGNYSTADIHIGISQTGSGWGCGSGSGSLDAVDDYVPLAENGSVTIDVTANDTGVSSISAVGTPGHGSASLSNGQITYTPSTDYAGDDSFTYTVTDGSSNTDTATVHVRVVGDGSHSPTVNSIGNQTNAEGDGVSLQVVATDLDFEPLTYDASNLPAGLSINTSTGLISGTIAYTAAETNSGSYSVTVTATDPADHSASQSFTWTVTNTNRPPEVNSVSDQTSAEGTTITPLSTGATDPDGDTLTYNASNLPAGLSINSTTGVISGTIAYTAAETNSGIYTVTVTASDGNASDSTTFTWTVTNTNRAPQVNSIGNQTSPEGVAITPLATGASDPDGDSFTFTATGLPEGLSIDLGTGAITGTPSYTAAQTNNGSYSVTVNATDSYGAMGTQSFTWTITNTNRAPIIDEIIDRTDAENDAISLFANATDPDGDTVSYSAGNLPTGLSINSSTGEISGTISFSAYQDAPGHDGIYSAWVSASDGSASQTTDFTWTVVNTVALSWTNSSPTYTWSQTVADPTVTNPGAQTSAEGASVSLAISASDPNSYTLTYAAVNLPDGLSINGSTGVISGTVGYQSAEDFDGNYAVTVIVANDHDGVATVDFDWSVTDTPRSPSITDPGDQSDAAGNTVSLQIEASQPDDEPLYYEADGLPWGLSIDSETGLISGTIEGWTASTTPYSVTITVTDYAPETPQVATQTFDWTVTAGVASVTLTQPDDQANAAGDDVYLPIEAIDGGGYALTYTASGLPDGLRIDPNSGEIYGTIANSAASATPYSVTVTASDGYASDSVTFTWTVGAVRLENPGDQTSLDGETIALELTATNAGTGTLSWSASGLPTGLSINTSTGEITGTIDNNANSSDPYVATVTVTDGTDSSSQTFDWYVSRLTLTNPGNQTNLEGATVSLQLASTDHVNTPTYSATNLPSGLSLNATTGEITGTISIDADGQSPYLVTVTATDGTLTSSQSFIWSVTPQIALVNPGTQGSATGDTVSLNVTAVDRANGTLAYSASGLPTGLSIDTATGEISGTIDAGAASTTPYSVTVTAADGTYSSSQTFSWSVANIYLPEVADQSNLNDDAVSLSTSDSYHGAGSLTYSSTGLPDGLTINSATGVISGTIDSAANQNGPYSATVTAGDGTDSASVSFTWYVDARVTVDAVDDQNSVPGDAISLDVFASSADDQATLTYSATGLPTGLSIDSATGEISGTISDAVSSTPYEVTVTVDDGTATASVTFDWLLVPVVLAHPVDQASVGEDTVELALSATVASGYTASYSATGLPTGLSINSGTGVISGTLDSGDTGNAYLVTVSATAGGVTSSHEFLWRVGTVVLTPPAEQTSNEGDTVSLQASASALSGTLSYSATGLPDGLSINSTTGEISGTIAEGAAEDGPYYLATVVASNGTAADSQSLYWTVNPRVAVTAIDGQLNVEGDTVSLQVDASETGATLTYSATGLPTGLSINSSTGLISGTVATAVSGSFDVIVTASDGTYSSDVEFTWLIHHANNSAPTLTDPGMQPNTVGDYVSLQVTANDADDDTLTYSAEGLPYGLWIDPDTGIISGNIYESALGATPYEVTITVDDNNGGVTTQTFSWVVNDSALAVTAASNLTATAGADAEWTVATFTNSDPYWAWWEFSALINWGDGTESDEGIIDGDDGSFTVVGSHVYARAGNYSITVTINDGYQTITDSGAVAVSAAPLTVTGGITLGAAAGIEVSGVVSGFTGNQSDAASDFAALINWGDGTSETGIVEGENGAFVVKGTHTFASTGTYTITVSVSGLDDAQGSNTSTAQVGNLLAGIESEFVVATFQSLDPNATVTQFSASVTWGDGTSSNSASNPDKVWITVGAGGVYFVHGKHEYEDSGTYTVGVTVNGPYGESINSITSVSAMSPAVSGYGLAIAAKPNVALSNVVVATFFDPNFSDVAGDFTATIDWGDGTTSSSGTIVAIGGGAFQVLGGHTYAANGSYTMQVQLQSAVGAVPLATFFATATVSELKDELRIVEISSVLPANPNSPLIKLSIVGQLQAAKSKTYQYWIQAIEVDKKDAKPFSPLMFNGVIPTPLKINTDDKGQRDVHWSEMTTIFKRGVTYKFTLFIYKDDKKLDPLTDKALWSDSIIYKIGDPAKKAELLFPLQRP